MPDSPALGQNVPNLNPEPSGLYLMDGITGLRSLPEHSVDMLLTDPPYGTTRNYWDVPLSLPELWEAVRWAVKPSGAVLFFAQCPYDKILGASNLSMLRYEWVWYKSRCTGFLNARRATLKKTENILVFYQRLPSTTRSLNRASPTRKSRFSATRVPTMGSLSAPGAARRTGGCDRWRKGGVTIGKYNVIYADPPWQYAQKGLQGAAERHYLTMGIEELCALPVADLAAPDSVLFLWATFPQLPEALRLIKAWGFQYKSVGFVWLKKNKKADSWFYGLGFWTRANAEVCLLAPRGHPRRKAPTSTSLSSLLSRATAKSRTRPGRKSRPLWGTCPAWSCSPARRPPAGTCGGTRWSPPWDFGTESSC